MNSNLQEYVAKLHTLYVQYREEKHTGEELLSILALYENKCSVVHNRFMAGLVAKLIITKTISVDEYGSVSALNPVKIFHFIIIYPDTDIVYSVLIDNIELFC